MSEILGQFYRHTITPNIATPEDYRRFTDRLKYGKLNREENPLSHSCAMTLAYEPETRKVLVVNHKKAHSWIFPGGHIEPNELPTKTALREAREEMGLTLTDEELIGPFGAQVLDIDNPPQRCREHYDIFYGIATKPSSVTVNMDEFLGYEWLDITSAKEKITMKYYKDALDKFVKFMGW